MIIYIIFVLEKKIVIYFQHVCFGEEKNDHLFSIQFISYLPMKGAPMYPIKPY